MEENTLDRVASSGSAEESETISSKFLLVSLKFTPSGAMSLSWKQKNGIFIFSKNSNAASTLTLAKSIFELIQFQSLCIVPIPN